MNLDRLAKEFEVSLNSYPIASYIPSFPPLFSLSLGKTLPSPLLHVALGGRQRVTEAEIHLDFKEFCVLTLEKLFAISIGRADEQCFEVDMEHRDLIL